MAMKRRRLKIGKEEGCSKQGRYLYAIAAFCLSTAFQKFSVTSGGPYCGDIGIGFNDPARTACLRSCAEKNKPSLFKFTIVIQGKKIPPETGSEGGVFIFYLSGINIADFSPLCINKSNTSGIRLDAVRVPMR